MPAPSGLRRRLPPPSGQQERGGGEPLRARVRRDRRDLRAAASRRGAPLVRRDPPSAPVGRGQPRRRPGRGPAESPARSGPPPGRTAASTLLGLASTPSLDIGFQTMTVTAPLREVSNEPALFETILE